MGFTKMLKDVLNISKLPDSVQDDAQNLKATFDRAGEDIKEAHNGLIDELEEENAASNIGASSKEGASTVQAELDKLNDKIHVDYTELEVEVDDELNEESENAVQNKVVTKELASKALVEKNNIPEVEVGIQRIQIINPKSYYDYYALDGTTVHYTDVSTTPLIIDLDEEIIPKYFSLFVSSGTILIEGSTDLDNWSTLYSAEISSELITNNANVDNNVSCRYLKISGVRYLYMFNIISWLKNGSIINGKYLPIMSSNVCEAPKLKLSLKVPLEKYQENQIVNIINKTSGILLKQDYEEVEFTSNLLPVFSNMGPSEDTHEYVWNVRQSNGYDSNTAWKAFDGDISTYFQSNSNATYSSASINSLPTGNKIALIKPEVIYIKAASLHTGLYIEGTKLDGTTETIYSYNETTSIDGEIPITAENYYKEITFFIAGKSGFPACLYSAEIRSGSIRYGIQEDVLLDSCSNATLVINNLEEIPIEGELKELKDYVLTYNNKKWNAQRKYKVLRGYYIGNASSNTSKEQTIFLGVTPEVITVWKANSTQFVKKVNDYNDDYYYDTSSNINVIENGFIAQGSSSSGYNAKFSKYYYEVLY